MSFLGFLYFLYAVATALIGGAAIFNAVEGDAVRASIFGGLAILTGLMTIALSGRNGS